MANISSAPFQRRIRESIMKNSDDWQGNKYTMQAPKPLGVF